MARLTKISACASIVALRSAALALIPHLDWRHHGIGCLQGYVREGGAVETRLHLWDPRLVKPGMEESGSVHDHRFELVSHVLAGTVGHEEWFASADPEGDHTTLHLTHARAAAASKFHGPVTPSGERFSVHVIPTFIHTGFSYRFPAGAFHRSPVPCRAITFVEKHNQRDIPARVLHPVEVPPVMAFGHEMDPALTADVLRRAMEDLNHG